MTNSFTETDKLVKTPTGIEGFDEITGGGLPQGRINLIMGASGCGKTVFALQTLANGARRWNEPGIFVAFEENSRQLIANAASFGWNLPELTPAQLFFVDARVSPDSVLAGGFDLAGLLAGLAAKAKEMGARRIAFDSLNVLLALLVDPAARRREVYRLHDWLQAANLTSLLTLASSNHGQGGQWQPGLTQTMADCIIHLEHRLQGQVSLRQLRVLKYRGSSFSENEVHFVIGPAGIEVAGFSPLPPDYQSPVERISSGVERLDTMLGGGYFRGSSVLVSGAPGTAKTTLGGAFALAACRRGETALFVSFDEIDSDIVRNLASVGLNLAPEIAAGRLAMQSLRSEARSAEEHLLELRHIIHRLRPRCLVIDPLSAMLKAGGQQVALVVAQRLLYMLKQEGITLLCTSLVNGASPLAEATQLHISTIADVWIHLSYVVQGGERNRALTIVKSRGAGHSNQVRELVLSNQGVTLADVYTAGGEVLMGTLRWEKELADKRQREQAGYELERRQGELELAAVEAEARIEISKRELAARRAELAALNRQQSLREEEGLAKESNLHRLRSFGETEE